MRRILDIAIAGAGPAGLAAALYLRRDGHRVTLFERFEQPKPVGSGLILQPTGLAVLNDLGLIDAIMARGARIDRLYGADARSGRTVLDVGYAAMPGGRFGLGVHRAALFGVLRDAVTEQGIEIVTGTSVDSIDAGGERAVLSGEGGRRIGAFDLVVDATGSRSRLKAAAYRPAEPQPLAYGAFWASLDWRGEGFSPNALQQRYEQAKVMIGVLPIGRIEPQGRDMAAFFWSLKPDLAKSVMAAGLDAWKARVAGYWPETQAYLDQIGSFDDLALARYGHHTLKPPAGRGLAVIGDAAHSTSPQLGQGANMALLDAAALAHALRGDADVADALAGYSRARRLHVGLFQSLSRLLTPFYQSDSTVVPFLRDRLVSTVARMPPAPRILATMVSGMLGGPFRRTGLSEPDWQEIAGRSEAQRAMAEPAEADAGAGGVAYLRGEFWTAGQRLGHSLHEVSYRACFKPQLPEYFIERLTRPGDVVYDPFMGRGTTLLQAALMGRQAVGNDVNPLSPMLVRPRLAPPTQAEVGRRLAEIPWNRKSEARRDLLVFYHRDTLRAIGALRAYLMARDREGTLDGVDDWIRMVAINRLTGHSSGFFSVYSMPPNQAVSALAQGKINARRNQTPPRRDVAAIIAKKTRTLLKDGAPQVSQAAFHTGPAEATPGIADASVDLVVTSPPFLDVVQYADDNWLRCWFAGIDVDRVPISIHRKPSDWQGFVQRTLGELGRVVRPGGHVAFEVGEVRGGAVRLEEFVLAAMAGTPFEPLQVLVNQQAFTKTANCWGVDNNAKGTNSNRIVLMRRI